jgi:hypothetical protein
MVALSASFAALAVALVVGAAQPTASGPVLFVTSTGSDSAPCSTSAPCRSFDRAYHLATPGQIVQIAAGTYPPQTMTYDASKAGATANVVFESVPGQLAVVGGIVGDGISHVTFVGDSHRDLTPPTAGITLKPTPAAMDTGADFHVKNCARFVDVENIDMRQFGIEGSDNITIDGGTVGGYDNLGGDSFVGGPYLGRGTPYCNAENPASILITHVVFHDVLRTNLPSAHPDCLQFYGTASSVVDGNVFLRCGTSDLIARPNLGLWSGDTIDSLVIQNNILTPAVEGGAILVLGAHADVCGHIVVAYNTSTGDGLSPFDCASYGSLEVVGNYQRGQLQFACSVILPKAAVYAYNVIGLAGGKGSASSCGRSSFLSGDPQFVDAAAGNFRISRGSPLTGRGDPASHPPTDIDGRPRPIRAAPDAGAYEWDVPTMQLGVSIGSARMGMTKAAVESFYGTPSRQASVAASSTARQERLTAALYTLHGGVLRVYYGADGRVAGLSTTSAYYTTPNGFGVDIGAKDSAAIAGFGWAKCRKARVAARSGKVVYVGLAGGRRAGAAVASIAFLPPHMPPCK